VGIWKRWIHFDRRDNVKQYFSSELIRLIQFFNLSLHKHYSKMLREILSVLVLNPFILSSNGVRGGENVGSVPAHQNDWYTGQYTNSIPAYSPPSSAYSGGQALARDSYAEAAASSGGTDLGHAQATKYHYQMFPSDSHHQQQYGESEK